MAPGGSHRGGAPPARTSARRKRVAARAYPTERQRSPAMTPGSKVQCSSCTSWLVASAGSGARRRSAGPGLPGDRFAPGDLIERLAVVGGEEPHKRAPHAERQDQPDDKEGGEQAAVLLE